MNLVDLVSTASANFVARSGETTMPDNTDMSRSGVTPLHQVALNCDAKHVIFTSRLKSYSIES